MKIRLRHRGDQTRNQCSAVFDLPFSCQNKTIKVLNIRCPDMPLVPSTVAAFTVVSASLSLNQAVDVPAQGSMEAFVDFLNQLYLGGMKVFDVYWKDQELEFDLLSPMDTVAFGASYRSLFNLPNTMTPSGFYYARVYTERFDTSLETEVRLEGVHLDGISDGKEFTNRIAIFGRDRVLSGEKSLITSSDTACRIVLQYIDTTLQSRYFDVPAGDVWGLTLEIE